MTVVFVSTYPLLDVGALNVATTVARHHFPFSTANTSPNLPESDRRAHRCGNTAPIEFNLTNNRQTTRLVLHSTLSDIYEPAPRFIGPLCSPPPLPRSLAPGPTKMHRLSTKVH